MFWGFFRRNLQDNFPSWAIQIWPSRPTERKQNNPSFAFKTLMFHAENSTPLPVWNPITYTSRQFVPYKGCSTISTTGLLSGAAEPRRQGKRLPRGKGRVVSIARPALDSCHLTSWPQRRHTSCVPAQSASACEICQGDSS